LSALAYGGGHKGITRGVIIKKKTNLGFRPKAKVYIWGRKQKTREKRTRKVEKPYVMDSCGGVGSRRELDPYKQNDRQDRRVGQYQRKPPTKDIVEEIILERNCAAWGPAYKNN